MSELDSVPAVPMGLISVVITCYNLEKYIGSAIESVLSQRDAGPFEIIVVDDCSQDASSRIIASYHDVRLISMESNSGVMLATLAGVEAAGSDMICFLDGDDLWEDDKLATIRPALSDPAVALVTHDLTFMDSKGARLYRPSESERVFGGIAKMRWPETLRNGILRLDGFIWLGSAFAVRKDAMRWADFAAWVRSLPDPSNVYQDWPIAYWIASLDGVKLAYVHRKLFRYRLHGANHSGDARTVERARRNHLRSKLTIEAIDQLAFGRSGVSPEARRKVRSRLALCTARLAFYEPNGRIAAVRQIPAALHDIIWRRVFLSETCKLIALALLGPARVARFKSWLS